MKKKVNLEKNLTTHFLKKLTMQPWWPDGAWIQRKKTKPEVGKQNGKESFPLQQKLMGDLQKTQASDPWPASGEFWRKSAHQNGGWAWLITWGRECHVLLVGMIPKKFPKKWMVQDEQKSNQKGVRQIMWVEVHKSLQCSIEMVHVQVIQCDLFIPQSGGHLTFPKGSQITIPKRAQTRRIARVVVLASLFLWVLGQSSKAVLYASVLEKLGDLYAS